jgi:non-homologous end joining protein Ku
MAKPKKVAAPVVEVEAPVVDKAAVVADLSTKLVSMLNVAKLPIPTSAKTPEKKTTKTSTFTGRMIVFDSIQFDVKTYVAAEADAIKRNMLHKSKTVKQMVDGVEVDVTVPCMGRIKENGSRCSSCNVDVDKDSIVKGVEVSKDKYVTLTDEEIAQYRPTSDKLMIVTETVEPTDVNPKYIEDSEYVSLDGDSKNPNDKVGYDHFVAGLRESGLWGRGVRVKGGREQYFIVRPEGFGLMMHYLFAEYEVRNCDKFSAPELNPEMTAVFAELATAKKVAFVPAPYDGSLAATRNLITAKAADKTLELPEAKVTPAPAVDLMASLRSSLASLKSKGATAGK